MSKTEISGLLSQIRAAAESIKAQIHEADRRIEALNQERNELTDAPVSKDDFIQFARADIQRRASDYPNQMKRWARNSNFPFRFSQLERVHVLGNPQPFPYLDGETAHKSEIQSATLYWHFGDLIATRFAAALDQFEWPAKAIPVIERRRRIAEIDTKLEEISAERNKLAEDLISTGMYE